MVTVTAIDGEFGFALSGAVLLSGKAVGTLGVPVAYASGELVEAHASPYLDTAVSIPISKY